MLAFLLSQKGAIILDWAGSMLMLGTVWVWMYERLDALIAERHKQSMVALEKFRKDLDAFWESRAEQMASYARPDKDDTDNTGCLVALATIPKQIAFEVPVATYRLFRQAAKTVLVGRIAKILFVFGLLLWNLSKALSYFVLP